ncbi:MAG: alpha-L-fucosidase [Clostridia bacterium]|nr:alpha-L-fucosidase [Clostridia bacterium]
MVSCVPAERQLQHARTEFYAFFHFGVNTFTDREWGDGTEDPAIFDPTDFDAGQWIDTAAAAGMKGVILTAKHHDGFCLWPSQYTEHSVKNSPFRNGSGDVVREVADACRERGMKFGIYLSPWDRHEPTYGQGKAYDDYFCNQLTELLTNYGELFSVWFDGACGEGPNGKVQSYDWDRYYAVIRKYQPNACIAISGPDVRWCGNEAGETRESEWSVLPTSYYTPAEVAAASQQAEGDAFRPKTGDLENRDFGGREYLKGARSLHWYPSETDTSIRPGWFYHASENNQVKSADTLIDLWYRTVGGNSSLLLNIPPDRRGRITRFDVRSLKGLGNYLKKTFAVNLAETASVTADKTDGAHTADALATDSYDAYYKAPDGETVAAVTFSLAEPSKVSHVVIKEHIPMSQRVERFAVDVKLPDGTWKKVAEGTSVGYQKVVKFDPVQTDAIRVRILDSRVCPVLSFIGIY